MLPGAYLGLCSRCIQRCARLSSPHRARRPASPFLTRNLRIRPYEAFAPLPPSRLPKPKKPKVSKAYRSRKWGRRLFYLGLTTTAIWALDKQFYASSLARTMSTFSLGIVVALDYKINFRPDPWIGDIQSLHTRNAERLFSLLRANGGLYLKIGQAIAMQSAILPPEFQKMFARMFDDASQNSWADVEQVVQEDFGMGLEEAFGVSFTGEQRKGVKKGVMEKTARASASVAQVHWARLADGREVAIKIQKKEIAQQVGWDLWTFKVVTYIYSELFDLPLYTLVPYITERLMLETDFENEAANSERMASLVASEPRLRDRVYIPKVYHELTTKRVMTAEWIEGVRLWDKESLTRTWKGPSGMGSPGCHGAPLDPPPTSKFSASQLASLETPSPPTDSSNARIKPSRDWWKGPNSSGGLGLSLKEVMTTMVDLFSAQMFLWGSVHCDPHPGNIFVRRKPNGKPELVLIDHGLYIQMQPAFRRQYALFWKSLMTFDNATLKAIVQTWGVNNVDIFASATLLRPYSGGDRSTRQNIANLSKKEQAQRHFEMQQQARQGIRDILGDETKWPKELIFLGRNLRIVQGNNQFLGSPVNRIKITGEWAARALVEERLYLPWRERMGGWGRQVVFRLVLWSSDVVFWFTKVRQYFRPEGGGMEDELEEQMRSMAKEYGVELNHNVFEG